MSKEKEYTFWESRGVNDPRSPHKIQVKESELTSSQKELLLGNVIHEFNNLPEELQMKFMHKVIEGIDEMLERTMHKELGFSSIEEATGLNNARPLEDLMDSEEFLNMPGDE